MIAIVDYRAGNLASVLRAVEHLGFEGRITDDPAVIRGADRVIIPGVGAAGEAMRNLRERGLDRTIREDVFLAGIPLLGICLGIQIVFEESEEDGASCLGLLPGRVARLPARPGLKVPQIGWNGIRIVRPHPILSGIPDGASFYFVNSHYPIPRDDDPILATTEYGIVFPSVIGRRNFVATQFHLEKSGRLGLRMLENFCRWESREDGARGGTA